MKVSFIYITVKNKAQAKKIGKELVKSRLAACVNIIDHMSSMYWWGKKIEYDQEAVLIAKTKESLVKELITKVKTMHSYSCPCVIALPVMDGNKAYLDWVAKESK